MMRSIEENVTRLKMFVAFTRHSRVRRRGKRNTRANVMSNDDVDGPRIELRAALAHVPAAGAANAARLAYVPAWTGSTGSPVSDGRIPTTPDPGTAMKKSGDTGMPLPALNCAVIVQSLKSGPHQLSMS